MKNAVPGDDPGVELTYAVRVNGVTVANMVVPNTSEEVHRLAIGMNVAEHDLVSVTVTTPMAGYPGTPPVPKLILLWRPLSAPRVELTP